MIPTDVRDSAQALLFAMEIGASSDQLRERLRTLLVAMRDPFAMQPMNGAEASQRLLGFMLAGNMMPAEMHDSLQAAGQTQLAAVVRHLGGSLPLMHMSHDHRRLYAVVLCLARVREGVLH